MCKKAIKNHTIRKAKKRCEKAAIMTARCARTYESTGNEVLADFWWKKYANLYDAIQAANTVL